MGSVYTYIGKMCARPSQVYTYICIYLCVYIYIYI